MTTKQERESADGVDMSERHRKYRALCDICKKQTGCFWGGTSMVVCSGDACQQEMAARWDAAMAQNSGPPDDDY